MDELYAEQFTDSSDLLFSIAYRIVGSAADADDIVQDAWLRWSATDHTVVRDPRSYLARIVTNLAVDRLRIRRRQRETYVGPWLPEPVLTEHEEVADAADQIAASDSVSMAMLIVLESLSPLDRAVFVLKEVFAFSYVEIAGIIDRSEQTVRQAGSRSRRHVQARRPRYDIEEPRRTAIIERFFDAVSGGDINALMELLSPDVTLWTDGGGKVRQAMRPVVGAQTVARWFAEIGDRSYGGVDAADIVAELVEINGAPGIVFSGPRNVLATVTVDIDATGHIAAIHNVANPDKLDSVGRRDPRRLPGPAW